MSSTRDDPATNDLAYADYWRRKRMIEAELPAFPVRRWRPTDQLCEIEQVYFDAIRSSKSLLDFGAGDHRVRHRCQAAGLAAEYHTLDVGQEFSHTYRDVSEVDRPYDAILCLDIIEHIPLAAGLRLIQQLANLLNPGGVLIVQTPNARCVRYPLSWDMTHVQCYNGADLWAHLRCQGLEVQGYRVLLESQKTAMRHKLRNLAARYIVSRLLQCDYADNLAMIARKPSPQVA